MKNKNNNVNKLVVSSEAWCRFEAGVLKAAGQRRKMRENAAIALRKRYDVSLLKIMDLGWAAGLFDGEGHCNSRERGGEFVCSMDQADRVVLERFQQIVGVGRISKAKRRITKTGKLQLIYTWAVTNQSDLNKFARAVMLLLCPAKQQQLARALSVPLVTKIRHDRTLDDAFEITVSR